MGKGLGVMVRDHKSEHGGSCGGVWPLAARQRAEDRCQTWSTQELVVAYVCRPKPERAWGKGKKKGKGTITYGGFIAL